MATAKKNSKPARLTAQERRDIQNRLEKETSRTLTRTRKDEERPFAAESPLTEEQLRDLEQADKRLREKDQIKPSRLSAQERREVEKRLEKYTQETLEEEERERNMRRGEAAAKKQMGTLGFKNGGLVTPRGQGKVMRSRKARMY